VVSAGLGLAAFAALVFLKARTEPAAAAV